MYLRDLPKLWSFQPPPRLLRKFTSCAFSGSLRKLNRAAAVGAAGALLFSLAACATVEDADGVDRAESLATDDPAVLAVATSPFGVGVVPKDLSDPDAFWSAAVRDRADQETDNEYVLKYDGVSVLSRESDRNFDDYSDMTLYLTTRITPGEIAEVSLRLYFARIEKYGEQYSALCRGFLVEVSEEAFWVPGSGNCRDESAPLLGGSVPKDPSDVYLEMESWKVSAESGDFYRMLRLMGQDDFVVRTIDGLGQVHTFDFEQPLTGFRQAIDSIRAMELLYP